MNVPSGSDRKIQLLGQFISYQKLLRRTWSKRYHNILKCTIIYQISNTSSKLENILYNLQDFISIDLNLLNPTFTSIFLNPTFTSIFWILYNRYGISTRRRNIQFNLQISSYQIDRLNIPGFGVGCYQKLQKIYVIAGTSSKKTK